jgi:hypothetical protein
MFTGSRRGVNTEAAVQHHEEIFNQLEGVSLADLKLEITKLPVLRPTESIQNEYILEQRKSFERAYEPWDDKENVLLLKAAEHTNDADFLAQVFKRNPSSVKIQLAKLLLKQQLLEEN